MLRVEILDVSILRRADGLSPPGDVPAAPSRCRTSDVAPQSARLDDIVAGRGERCAERSSLVYAGVLWEYNGVRRGESNFAFECS